MFCEPLFYIQRIHSFLFCISNVLMTIPPRASRPSFHCICISHVFVTIHHYPSRNRRGLSAVEQHQWLSCGGSRKNYHPQCQWWRRIRIDRRKTSPSSVATCVSGQQPLMVTGRFRRACLKLRTCGFDCVMCWFVWDWSCSENLLVNSPI